MGNNGLKISELPAMQEISQNDLIIVVDVSGSITCKCTIQQLIQFISENLAN